MKNTLRRIVYLLTLANLCINSRVHGQPADSAESTAIITIIDTSLIDGDTVSLVIWDNIISNSKKSLLTNRQTKSKAKAEQCTFRIQLNNNYSYFSIGYGYLRGVLMPIMDTYLICPGDSIVVNISSPTEEAYIIQSDKGKQINVGRHKFKFSGLGHLKYECVSQLRETADKASIEWGDSLYRTNAFDTFVVGYHKRMKYILSRQQEVLENFRDSIDPEISKLILTNFVGRTALDFFQAVHLNYSIQRHTIPKYQVENAKRYYLKHLNNVMPFHLPDSILSESYSLSDAYLKYAQVLNDFMEGVNVYNLICNKLTGSFKEKVLVNYFLNYIEDSNVDSKISMSLTLIKNPLFTRELRRLIDDHKPGTLLSNAPLIDVNGNFVQLSDFRGKVLFIHFWFTGCSGCARYYKDYLTVVEKELKDSRIEFISISVDGTKEKWNEGLSSNKFTSSKSINVYTGGKGIQHPLISQLVISNYPHILIADTDSRIVFNNTTNLTTGGPNQVVHVLKSVVKKSIPTARTTK
jgi:Peroxiredoxin